VFGGKTWEKETTRRRYRWEDNFKMNLKEVQNDVNSINLAHKWQLRALCVHGNEASGCELQNILLLADQLSASQERVSSAETVT
jgi:hypothetical protein